MSEGPWVDPMALASIEAFRAEFYAQSGTFKPNTIVMSRRVFDRLFTAPMTKRQRRRWRGRFKGRVRLGIARGDEWI